MFFRPGFMMHYASSQSLPSVEQLRPRIDDSNLLMLRSGNPSLQPSRTHSFHINRQFRLDEGKKGTFTVGTGGWAVRRAIVSRMLYFGQGGAWEGYQVPSGSTLYTYDNVNGMYSANVQMGYNVRVHRIKTSFSVNLNDVYRRSPQYQGYTPVVLYEHGPGYSLMVMNRSSRQFMGMLTLQQGFTRFWNDAGEDIQHVFQTQLRAETRVGFLKHAFVSAEYSFSSHLYRFPEQAPVRMNLLVAMVGYSILKGALVTSLSGSNLLDSAPSYRTEVTANYISQTWHNYFGRCVMLNIAYRFNSTGNKVKFGGRLRDGSAAGIETIVYDAPPL